MKKFPISREFFPWNLFAPPISEKFLAMSVPHMKPPKFLWKDRELNVTTHEIISYDGERITCFVLSPKSLPEKAPCLMYFHGGGFVLEAAGYHYRNAMRYAKEVGCKVVWLRSIRFLPSMRTAMPPSAGLMTMLRIWESIYSVWVLAATVQVLLWLWVCV